MGNFLMPILIVMVLFYLIMLGPERKQRKKREEMLAAVKKGDKVMLNSGMYGTVANLADDVVTVQVAEGVRIRFARSSIQTVFDAEGESGAKEKAEKAKG
jgi:preprotein translocase subunit YajC